MNRLQKIFTDNWAIHRHTYDNMMALLVPCVLRGNINEALAVIAKSQPSITAMQICGRVMRNCDFNSSTLPENSVAVITLEGALYSWGSDRLVEMLEAAAANDKVCGVVLNIDGPGGMISHIDRAVAAIENFPKPIATVVYGMMASAHFWLGTATERTFIASPMCEVGSVGVMTHYTSLQGLCQKLGIESRDIYPDTADLKNHSSRLLESGDDSEVKQSLQKYHGYFAESVAKHLGIEYDPEAPLFRGAMFDAVEAVEKKYINQFGDLADACTWVLAQATSRKAALLY